MRRIYQMYEMTSGYDSPIPLCKQTWNGIILFDRNQSVLLIKETKKFIDNVALAINY